MPGNLEDEGANDEYMERFSKLCWASIVNDIIAERPGCLKGEMARFNAKETLVSSVLTVVRIPLTIS